MKKLVEKTVKAPNHRHCDVCEMPEYTFWQCEDCGFVSCKNKDHQAEHEGACTYPKYWYEVHD